MGCCDRRRGASDRQPTQRRTAIDLGRGTAGGAARCCARALVDECPYGERRCCCGGWRAAEDRQASRDSAGGSRRRAGARRGWRGRAVRRGETRGVTRLPARIHGGCAGGGLFDAWEHLTEIATAAVIRGFGAATPASIAAASARQILTTGGARGFIGVAVQPVQV